MRISAAQHAAKVRDNHQRTKNAQQRNEVPDKRVISLLLFKIIFTLLKG
jgi:hypothetical protein